MSREGFEARYQEQWQEFDALLEQLDARKPIEADRFLELYRGVCHQLALARHRQYSADVVRRLNGLARRGHERLYGAQANPLGRARRYLSAGFARDVRRHKGYLWAALALFGLPFFGLIGVLQLEPELVHAIIPPAQLVELEAMYEPSANQAAQASRGVEQNILMFGFYIYNNVGIAFRTFASGLLFGLGSIFFLVYNGVFIGASAGHLTQIGYTEPFWSFVIGHGAFELTAIVLAGMTGLKIGFALLAPGQRTRARALVEEGRDSAGLVGGFATMLVIAAFLEAFWSPLPIDAASKYAVGGILWLAVIGYFVFAGRGDGS